MFNRRHRSYYELSTMYRVCLFQLIKLISGYCSILLALALRVLHEFLGLRHMVLGGMKKHNEPHVVSPFRSGHDTYVRRKSTNWRTRVQTAVAHPDTARYFREKTCLADSMCIRFPSYLGSDVASTYKYNIGTLVVLIHKPLTAVLIDFICLLIVMARMST